MPGKNYIKAASILLIITGAVCIVIYPVAGLLLGWATVKTQENLGWIFVVVCLLYTFTSLLQFTAGVKGIKGCDKKEAVDDLKKWGTITMAIFVASRIVDCISAILHGASPLSAVLGIALGFILPGLYLYGVSLNRKA